MGRKLGQDSFHLLMREECWNAGIVASGSQSLHLGEKQGFWPPAHRANGSERAMV